ncbi:UDP-3-O-(3-hydroxymyristoyl)glucosamine N-acyltransferase [bacterium MnTg03]|jgi:UDP-3-O-[3-hydroxymyristoyl] glucosamine N-acyltransferase|nr:UDP-3-O-(3-hydroxymyristoyl)glucosamine N-acyltransferase [bacterium MnTg03]
MKLTLRRLAGQLQLEFRGEPDQEISGVASLISAVSGDLCFIRHKKYLSELSGCQCSVLIVPLDFDQETIDKSLIFAENPHFQFVQAMAIIEPELIGKDDYQQHDSAQISSASRIGKNVSIGALAVIEDDVDIGEGTSIGAGCIIEKGANIGRQCKLHSRVTIGHRVVVGDRCVLHPGVVLGSDGFGQVWHQQHWVKVPQIGSVIIGDDVEIGANTTVDRGALDDTVIEQGCKLDNLIQIGHNARIGAHTAIAACVGIGGSAKIGRHCKISGGVMVRGHLSIVDHVTLTGMSMVIKDIKLPGVYSSGTPLLENRQWHKNNARYKSLDRLARTVALLEKQQDKSQ